MSASNSMWELPGPGGFVRDIRRTASRGLHVAAVLPRLHFEQRDSAATLVDELSGVREDIEHLFPDEGAPSLIEALGSGVLLDEPVVTVRALMAQEELAGRTFVFSAGDLRPEHRSEVPELLRRLESDSRAVSSGERPTFVAVVSPGDLPARGDTSRVEVMLEEAWLWNRVSRWDVAAYLAIQDRDDRSDGLLAEVRTETIIEAAKWDLELASVLSNEWPGDAVSLLDFLKPSSGYESQELPPHRREYARRPPEGLVGLWDEGGLGFWHGAVTVATAHRNADITSVDRLVWTAQARVLLPWVELRREQLARRVEEALGVEEFRSFVRHASREPKEDSNDDVVEIGLLAHLVTVVYGRSRRQFTDTAHALRRARNSLAHLRPMSDLEIRNLVERTQWLV